MTERRIKKILVGLDGSDRAMAVVKYLSNISSLNRCEIALMTVFDEIPQAYRDLAQQQYYRSRIREVMAWDTQHKRELEKQVNAAKQILIDKGIPEAAVTIRLRKRERGIATDLIHEAGRLGYDAVAVGRRGVNQLTEMVLGSVSLKLMEKLHSKPLILVGREATPGRIIVGFDGSANAMRTVRFVAVALQKSGFHVRLLHVVRSNDKDLKKVVQKDVGQQFEAAKGIFTDYGFSLDNIETEILYGEESRSGAIVREARSGDYGTIAMGRRGLSKVEEFFMGRVTNKVAYMARGLALWIVN
ncbi:MAG: universal stress protein [Deltaproteobacteria bacterium]|nr:universal stress protein [Deltaproteobacteria bacterium]